MRAAGEALRLGRTHEDATCHASPMAWVWPFAVAATEQQLVLQATEGPAEAGSLVLTG
jgi:hypothetical protein